MTGVQVDVPSTSAVPILVMDTISKPSKKQKFLTDLISGGTSAAVSKTLVAPLERVKLLLQVDFFLNFHEELF